MRAQETAQFDALARDTAATVHATVRRWWLDGKDRSTLHIEAERTFVGARPVIVHFSVPLSKTRLPTPARPPQMEIGVIGEPSDPKKTRSARQKARPSTRRGRATATKTRTAATKTRTAARKTRTAARKTRTAARKTRVATTKVRPASRKTRPARRATTPQQSRQQRQKRTRSVSKKTRRTASRR